MLFEITPETYGLICLFIITVAFLVAQIIITPDPKPSEQVAKAPASRPATMP